MEALLLNLSRGAALRCVGCCLALSPVAHLTSIAWHGLPGRGTKAFLAFPFSGGKRAAAFQFLGWCLWSLSTMVSAPLMLSNPVMVQLSSKIPLVPHTHVDVLSGAAAVCSFIGLLFLLKAMLVYERGPGSETADEAWRPSTFQRLRRRVLNSRIGLAICRYGPAAAVLLMGLLLSVTGVLLLLSVEHMPDVPSRLLYCCLSLVCLIIGASSTHGLGGYLQWGRPPPSLTAHHPSMSRTRLQHASSSLRRDASARCYSPLSEQETPRAASLNRALSRYSDRFDEALDKGSDRERDDDGLMLSHTFGSTAMSARGNSLSVEDEQTGAIIHRMGGKQGGSAWAFFQPFAGGSIFVATQAVAWSLFAVTIVLVLGLVKATVAGVLICVRCWVVGCGALMMATQLMLGVSVLTWRNSQAARSFIAERGRRLRSRLSAGTVQEEPESPRKAAAAPAVPKPPSGITLWLSDVKLGWKRAGVKGFSRAVSDGFKHAMGLHLPMIIMYVPVQTFFTCWALTFTFCPTRWVLYGWLTLLPLGYIVSLVGEPQHTGSRIWPAFRDWMTDNLEKSLAWWIGHVTVVQDWEGGPPPADNKYIFGFHPHGLYPTGAGFLPMLPSFKRIMRGIDPITLTASVIYYLPAIKDLSLWLGFRQVSRRTFVRALRDRGAVVVCPGGQAELVYAYASHFAHTSVAPRMKKRPSQAVPVSNGHQEPQEVKGVKQQEKKSDQCETQGPEQEMAKIANGHVQNHDEPGHSRNKSTDSNAGSDSYVMTATSSSPVASTADLTQEAVMIGQDGEQLESEQGSQLRNRKRTNTDKIASVPSHVNLMDMPEVVDLDTVDQAAFHKKTDAVLDSKPNQNMMPKEARATFRPIGSDGCHAAGELVIYAGHKGFVRLAIEQQACLVPVLAVGEVLQLRNLIHWPSLQITTYKRFGFPIPWFMVGRWGISPLPLRTPLMYVIGAPLQPPKLAPGATVQQADVDALHEQFYQRLGDMFERHKHRHPAFKDATLTMLSSHMYQM